MAAGQITIQLKRPGGADSPFSVSSAASWSQFWDSVDRVLPFSSCYLYSIGGRKPCMIFRVEDQTAFLDSVKGSKVLQLHATQPAFVYIITVSPTPPAASTEIEIPPKANLPTMRDIENDIRRYLPPQPTGYTLLNPEGTAYQPGSDQSWLKSFYSLECLKLVPNASGGAKLNVRMK